MKEAVRLLLLALVLLAGCRPRQTSSTPVSTYTSWVSIREIEKDPEAWRDQAVRMQGYGVIMATFPLCPGYVGLDRRAAFVDAARDHIPAVVVGDVFGQSNPYSADQVRVFEGSIRIFEGEIGCPGQARVERFPYFEITGVK